MAFQQFEKLAPGDTFSFVGACNRILIDYEVLKVSRFRSAQMVNLCFPNGVVSHAVRRNITTLVLEVSVENGQGEFKVINIDDHNTPLHHYKI